MTIIYGSLSAVLLVVIATVALLLAPPSTPSLAEFAPSPEETIENAPESQSSRFGPGGGTCPTGMVCDRETGEVVARVDGRPLRESIDKARVRRCVGDPSRQIEDPQSPPCVNYWDGDNGGSTWQGVTRDEIRVALPWVGIDDVLVEFFNRRFEFYGRKIVLVGTRPAYSAESVTPAGQRAAAVKVDEELDAFASMSYLPAAGNYFYEELARRKVMSVGDGYRRFAEERHHYKAAHPYQWNYVMASDQLLRGTEDLVCRSMVGRTAAHAGAQLQTRERAFGVIRVWDEHGHSLDPEPTLHAFRACGLEPVGGEFTYVSHEAAGSSRSGARNLLAEFAVKGVTSVVCLCNGQAHGLLMEEADRAGYEPEWVSTGLGYDLEWEIQAKYDAPQRSRYFGVIPGNKVLPEQDRPYHWALKETAPEVSVPPTNAAEWGMRYQQLLLLSSGIQMAGPILTPERFAKGLMATRFPNPGCGKHPYYQACVGFRSNSHTMVDDLPLVWWDETSRSHEQFGALGTGAWCYIGQGARFSPGSFPSGAQPFFDRTRPCR